MFCRLFPFDVSESGFQTISTSGPRLRDACRKRGGKKSLPINVKSILIEIDVAEERE